MAGAVVVVSSYYYFSKNNRTVSDILKTKKGSIKNAPKPPGSPSWNSILTLTLSEVQRRAQQGWKGYKEIYKLLNDGRFN